MPTKKITIVYLPDGTTKVRQFKIPKPFLVFCILFFFLSVGVISWGIRDYSIVKRKVPRLAELEKENEQQRIQLVSFAQKLDQVGKELVDLKKFDNKLKIMVNLEPSEDNTQFLGIGGSDASILDPNDTFENAHKKLVRWMHKSVENLDTEISVQMNEKVDLFKYLEEQKDMLAHTPSIWPTKGWVSSRFGYRKSPFTNEREFHSGMDISTRMNTPILAPADGVVKSRGKNYGYGKMLTVSHGYGLETKYAHVAKILVKKGQYVKRGETIALVGNTGRSTGPHLHYEVNQNGVAVNPNRYILN